MTHISVSKLNQYLVQIMACRLYDIEPLPEPLLLYVFHSMKNTRPFCLYFVSVPGIIDRRSLIEQLIYKAQFWIKFSYGVEYFMFNEDSHLLMHISHIKFLSGLLYNGPVSLYTSVKFALYLRILIWILWFQNKGLGKLSRNQKLWSVYGIACNSDLTLFL